MTVDLHAEMEIPHPAEAVWKVLADYSRDPQWRGGVETMEPSPAGLVLVGTTTAETMRFAGRTLHNDGEVIMVEPGHRFQWRTTSGASARGSRAVEALDRDRCRVRLELHVDPRPAERLMLPLIRRLLDRSLKADVRRLADLVAADAAHPVPPVRCEDAAIPA